MGFHKVMCDTKIVNNTHGKTESHNVESLIYEVVTRRHYTGIIRIKQLRMVTRHMGKMKIMNQSV